MRRESQCFKGTKQAFRFSCLALRLSSGRTKDKAFPGHIGHRQDLRALQTLRPCAISRCENITQSFFRHDLYQVFFDFFRVLLLRQSQAMR